MIGSSCIGASVIGGVCNNSGGSLVKRGPAYTEMALYAQLGKTASCAPVNHLGIRLGDTPEEILTRLEKATIARQTSNTASCAPRITSTPAGARRRCRHPSRFNADKRRLYEASGCAGKLAVFAVRLDTFEKEGKEQVFYIGTNDTAVLTELRRHMLSQFENLPVAGEYMHRDIFDIAEVYGKDTFMMIDKLGTDQMPRFFHPERPYGRQPQQAAAAATQPDRSADAGLSHLAPSHLPKRMKEYRERFEHHLLLKMAGPGVDEAQRYLTEYFARAEGAFFACTPDEGKRPSCTASPPPAPPCATMRCTPTRWRIFWRWISPCAATTPTGSKPCRRRLTANWCISCITATLCATSSIRTTW